MPCISEDEISRTINSLKNASAGWDNIPTFVVKKVSKHVIRPLTYLINKSIEQGIFPDELKVAKVFPIYKSGDKKCISSVCEKFQTTRAKVAPVNLIYGSHFSATEATYTVSLKIVNFIKFTRTFTRIRRKPVSV